MDAGTVGGCDEGQTRRLRDGWAVGTWDAFHKLHAAEGGDVPTVSAQGESATEMSNVLKADMRGRLPVTQATGHPRGSHADHGHWGCEDAPCP